MEKNKNKTQYLADYSFSPVPLIYWANSALKVVVGYLLLQVQAAQSPYA